MPTVMPWIGVILLMMSLSMPAAAAIAFVARLDDGWRAHVQLREGEPPRAVPAHVAPGDHGAPALSPDGRFLAFEVAGHGSVVCRIEDWRCIPTPADGAFAVRPSWQPGTHRLLLVRYDVTAEREDSGIVALEVDESEDGPVFVSQDYRPVLTQTGNQDFPAVSGDGRWLAYSSAQLVSPYRGTAHVLQSLWVLDLVSVTPRPVTLGHWQDIHPAWAADGRRLAFASNREGEFNIYVMSAPWGTPEALLDDPGPKYWPAWSPSGEEVMFTWVREERYGLWIVRLEDGAVRPFRPFDDERTFELRDGDWQ